MRAILIFMELVIRSGVLLLKLLAVAIGVTLVVAAVFNPQVTAVIVIVFTIGFVAWTPVKRWMFPPKDKQS